MATLGSSHHTRDRNGGAPPAAGALHGRPQAPFELRFPAGWERAAPEELAGGPSPPAVVLRRADGRGVVTLNVRGPIGSSLDELSARLTRGLAERFADFALMSSRPLDVPAGRALFTSWVLEDAGQVQASLVVEVDGRAYLLDAAVPAGSTQAAREAGAILASFEVHARA